MKRVTLFACVLSASVAPALADPSTRIVTQCQQNVDDGRILIVDGRLMPRNRRIKIAQYRPTRSDSMGWTYGSCVAIVGPMLPAKERLAY